MKIFVINCCFFYIFYIYEIVICYFLVVCVIWVMKEMLMYSVNLLIFVRNFIEVVVIGRYCFYIGLKKKVYIYFD